MVELIIASVCMALVIMIICGAWCEAEHKAPRFVRFVSHLAICCVGAIIGGVVYCIVKVIAVIING